MFDMVVAGRVVGDDVAIMMVEAEATTETIELVAGGAQAPTEEVVAQGLEAAKPFIRSLCVAQQQLADVAAKPTGELPDVPGLPARRVRGRRPPARPTTWPQALTIAGKQERESRLDEVKAAVLDKARRRSSRAARRRSAPRSGR